VESFSELNRIEVTAECPVPPAAGAIATGGLETVSSAETTEDAGFIGVPEVLAVREAAAGVNLYRVFSFW
jgi:hypothetical protein